MKSDLVTSSFSALSMSTSTVDVACGGRSGCVNVTEQKPPPVHVGSEPLGDLDVSVHGRGLGRPDQTLQFSTAVVLGLCCQLLDIHITGQEVEVSHLTGVNVEDLKATFLIGQTWRSGDQGVRRGERGCVKRHKGWWRYKQYEAMKG